MPRLLRALLLTGTCLAGGLLAGAATTMRAYGEGRNPYARLDTLARVLTDIELYWVGDPEPDKLVDNAIRGMVSGLDRHSLYLDPELWARVQAGNEDGLDNLGLDLGADGGALTVTAVVPGGPADRAGLKVGDALLAVDGVDVSAWSVAEVARVMDGPQGAPITLSVRRGAEPLSLTAVRDRVIAPAVLVDSFSPGWGYARVLHFRHRVSSELARGLETLEAQGGPLRGLVLDLRDNPGGVLDEAVGIADLFLSDGLIVETRGRIESENAVRRATKAATDRAIPLVVLINGGSASASEIVAGALHDLGRATLVGTKTYGKGSVQSVYEFEDRSALKLTVARYYLAKGETIADGDGIVPDVVVPLDPDETPEARLRAAVARADLDPALRAQMEADIDRLVSAHEAPAETVPWDGKLGERLDRDRQLAQAWRTLRGAKP